MSLHGANQTKHYGNSHFKLSTIFNTINGQLAPHAFSPYQLGPSFWTIWPLIYSIWPLMSGPFGPTLDCSAPSSGLFGHLEKKLIWSLAKFIRPVIKLIRH